MRRLHIRTTFVRQESVRRRPSKDSVKAEGADGINSFVRSTLWGEQLIRHQRLHLVGGYLFLDGPLPTEGVVARTRSGNDHVELLHCDVRENPQIVR